MKNIHVLCTFTYKSITGTLIMTTLGKKGENMQLMVPQVSQASTGSHSRIAGVNNAAALCPILEGGFRVLCGFPAA